MRVQKASAKHRWLRAGGAAALFAALVLAWLRFAPAESAPSERDRVERRTTGRAHVISTQAPPARVPRLTGKIVDAQARPLAGASICASCSMCDSGLSAAPLCTHSDGQGRYGLEALPAGDYFVSAAAVGYRPKVGNGGRALSIPERAGPARQLDIQLDSGGAIVSGTVVDSAGGPIAQASVQAFFTTAELGFGEFAAQTANSDADGKFSLTVPEGMINLIAYADGYSAGHAERPAPSADLEIALTPAASVRGTVVNESGERIAGVRVLAERAFAPPQQARSDEEGLFTITRLTPGIYSLRAQGKGWIGDHPDTIALTVGESVRDVALVVRKAATVRGVLMRADRTPCPQGRVHLGPVGYDHSVPILETLTDAQGAVTFEATPQGKYQVSAMCIASDMEPVGLLEVGTNDHAGLVWTLSRRLDVTGRVVDDRARPVRSVMLELRSETNPQLGMQTTSGAGGAFVFRGVPPGNYSINGVELSRPVPVALAEGASSVDIVVVAKPVGEIEVHVANRQGKAVDGLSLLAIASGGRPSNVTDELGNGIYRIGPLLTGSYAVYVSDGINPRVRVGGKDGQSAVRTGESTRLDVTFGGYAGRITGRVLDDAGGALENVWVQAVSADADRDPTQPMQAARNMAIGRRALTDAEGRFELTGLAEDGSFDVHAELPLGGVAKKERIAPGATVDIVMQALATLSGVAVDAQGQPVRHLSLGIRNAQTGQQRMEMISDPAGRFRLKHVTPGPVQITASDPSANVALASWNVSPGQRLDDLRLELLPMPQPALPSP